MERPLSLWNHDKVENVRIKYLGHFIWIGIRLHVLCTHRVYCIRFIYVYFMLS